jgi:hypothetical protein
MKFSDMMLPEWVGVLGSAVISAVIIALAVPGPSDDLGYAGSAQLQGSPNGESHSAAANKQTKP